MINDITAMVLSELSYVTIEKDYEGQPLRDIVNNKTFQDAHAGDAAFQTFLKDYELFPERYDSILSSHTLILTGHYDSNYNGIALLNNQTNVAQASRLSDNHTRDGYATLNSKFENIMSLKAA